ncbi:hypothetical protein ABZ647_20265 [Micromonospora aurantiaca]|uniref:hypothetical protein n=1 Tax=Micromonospora aurantiaca (nom. illeg.) TaxID=47850 RepID=UPI0033DB08CF
MLVELLGDEVVDSGDALFQGEDLGSHLPDDHGGGALPGQVTVCCRAAATIASAKWTAFLTWPHRSKAVIRSAPACRIITGACQHARTIIGPFRLSSTARSSAGPMPVSSSCSRNRVATRCPTRSASKLSPDPGEHTSAIPAPGPAGTASPSLPPSPAGTPDRMCEKLDQGPGGCDVVMINTSGRLFSYVRVGSVPVNPGVAG